MKEKYTIDEIVEEKNREEAESIILKEKMYRAINDLPTKCQEIFKMNKLNGLTYKEIAQNLSLSEKLLIIRCVEHLNY